MNYSNALSTFIKFSVTLASLLGLFGSTAVFAAAVNYTAPATISLTSPVTSFTVASGSVADVVVVNAGNFTVKLSSSTGGSFVFSNSSLDYDITPAVASVGGSVTNTCVSGVSSSTLTQNIDTYTYTVTPAGSVACGSVAGTPSVGYGTVSSGGGGGGGGSVAPTTTTTATTTTTTTATTTPTTTAPITTSAVMPSATISSIQAQIAALLAKLQELQAKVMAAKGSQQGAAVSAPLTSTIGSVISGFAKNLTIGSRGNDISRLQEFLISQNSGPEAEVLAGYGATGYFGNVTRKTLAEFQKKAGIEPAVGFFGPITRARVNSMMGQ